RRSWIGSVLGVYAVLGLSGPGLHARPADPAVRFDLTLDKDKYEVGEPIELNIRLTNVGDVIFGVPESSEVTGRHDDYTFTVRNDKGETLQDPMHEYISLMHSLGSEWPLHP